MANKEQEQEYSYITFNTVTQALRAEKVLADLKKDFMLVPIPREITADCGLCLMCAPEDTALIIETLEKTNSDYDQVHTLKKPKATFFRRLFD